MRTTPKLTRKNTMRSVFLGEAGLKRLLLTEADIENHKDYDTEALAGNHFRCEVSSGLWSLHSPLTGVVKPRGYAASGGELRTHERPETVSQGNPFDLANKVRIPYCPFVYRLGRWLRVVLTDAAW